MTRGLFTGWKLDTRAASMFSVLSDPGVDFLAKLRVSTSKAVWLEDLGPAGLHFSKVVPNSLRDAGTSPT